MNPRARPLQAGPAAPVATYRQHAAGNSWWQRARAPLRDAAVTVLSAFRTVPTGENWIRFPYYHHVYQDERARFARQLSYLRNLGEFVSIDDAVSLLESSAPLDGRYFCITFDDGFRSCLDGAVPVLVDHGAPAAFFVPTQFIGTSIRDDAELIRSFYPHGRILVEFLGWDDCRQMAAAGMTIGSHTVTHARLADLSADQVEHELRRSKQVIEQQMGVPCEHFAVPLGRAGIHFLPDRDPALAAGAGYRSFLTGDRGSARRRGTPLAIERDHVLAGWRTDQLRYFLSR